MCWDSMASRNNRRAAALLVAVALLTGGGCCRRGPGWAASFQHPGPVAPLGTISDPIWQTQEVNANASEFVVYQHEFNEDEARLNWAGEDHLTSIAQRLQQGQDFPVIVERSTTSATPAGQFQYPVYPNPELDLRRREVVVGALARMGVADAASRVVVAPALARGLEGTEAEAAAARARIPGGLTGGFGGFGNFGGFGGFGGGFGGLGGFGGFGGFGGGIF